MASTADTFHGNFAEFVGVIGGGAVWGGPVKLEEETKQKDKETEADESRAEKNEKQDAGHCGKALLMCLLEQC